MADHWFWAAVRILGKNSWVKIELSVLELGCGLTVRNWRNGHWFLPSSFCIFVKKNWKRREEDNLMPKKLPSSSWSLLRFPAAGCSPIVSLHIDHLFVGPVRHQRAELKTSSSDVYRSSTQFNVQFNVHLETTTVDCCGSLRPVFVCDSYIDWWLWPYNKSVTDCVFPFIYLSAILHCQI